MALTPESVYVVKVRLINEHAVYKAVLKVPVFKAGPQWVTVKVYGLTNKYPAADCFLTLEEAQVEADGRAAELTAKLMRIIHELKEPAVLDEVMQS